MREIHWRMDAIRIRKNNETSQNAAMHGIKLPILSFDNNKENTEFTKEQDDYLNQKIKEAQQRKTSEIRARNNGN